MYTDKNSKDKPTAKELLMKMTTSEWMDLDVPKFLLEHCTHLLYRFMPLVNEGSIEYDELVNEFYINVSPVMVSQHKENLDIPVERRHIMFFGYLNAILNTRFRQEIYSKLPLNTYHSPFAPPDNIPGVSEGYDSTVNEHDNYNYFVDKLLYEGLAGYSSCCQYQILYAAPMHMLPPEEKEHLIIDKEHDEVHLLEMLEVVREKFTQHQYYVFYNLLFAGKTVSDLAKERGVLRSSIGSTLREIRMKLKCHLENSGLKSETILAMQLPEKISVPLETKPVIPAVA